VRTVDGVTNSVELVVNDEYYNIGVSNSVGLIIYIRVGSSLTLFSDSVYSSYYRSNSKLYPSPTWIALITNFEL